MTTRAEAFRRQVVSDLAAFDAVMAAGLPDCHGLHFLQMATEKLGKAVRTVAAQSGADAMSHLAIVTAMRLLRNQRRAAAVLSDGGLARWQLLVDRVLPLLQEVERLAPAVAGDGANPEYPWERRPKAGDWIIPAEHVFGISKRLRTPEGARMLALVRRLADRFDELFK